MGSWYTIGLLAGVGAAVGVLVAGLFPRLAIAALGATAVAVGIGFAAFDWDEAVAGAVGGFLGALGAATIVSGALRRGGTRGGTATLVALAAVVTAGLAFVPALGYLEAVALPALALRLRKREPERYAGLRTLARD
jgi:hypothetical protein